jgi:hypothetical protein
MKYALAVAIALVLLVSPGASAGGKRCETVRGVVSFHATGADTFAGTVRGDLTGTLVARGFRIVKTHRDGRLSYEVDTQEIVTDRGTVSAFVRGTFSPFAEPDYYWAVERNFIRRGTGEFKGATGTLDLETDADLAAGAGSGIYKGRICVR